MRSPRWFIAFSLALCLAANTLASCGSNSSGATGAGARGGSAGGGGTGGGGGGAGGGGTDAGVACIPMDVSVATVDAGALWGCFESACMAQLVGCASECACNNAVLGALGCVATGGAQTTCFAPLASAGTSGAALGICLFTSTSGCNSNRDAGTEGPADSASEASANGADASAGS